MLNRKKGLTYKKKRDLKTPRGSFKFEFLLFRKDRVKNINTKLKKIKILKNMGWCDDPNLLKLQSINKVPF